jgi:hypothetical protein
VVVLSMVLKWVLRVLNWTVRALSMVLLDSESSVHGAAGQ